MSEDDRVAEVDTVASQRWDVDALRAGGAVCLGLAVPFRILAAAVNSDSGALNAVLFFLYVTFFVIGAGCAAWVQRAGTPLSHGLVTAVGAYLIVEFVFTIIRFVRHTDTQWLQVLFTLSVITLAGLLGGSLGSRLQTKGFVPSSRR